MRYILLIAFSLCLSFPALAQITEENAQQRLELAKQLHEIKPVRPQIDRTINNLTSRLQTSQQKAFTATIKRIINYKAVEEASINAMSDIFSIEELQAMIDYYSTPEAKSANAKMEEYQNLVRPEITKMLDRALMEMKTGGSGG